MLRILWLPRGVGIRLPSDTALHPAVPLRKRSVYNCDFNTFAVFRAHQEVHCQMALNSRIKKKQIRFPTATGVGEGEENRENECVCVCVYVFVWIYLLKATFLCWLHQSSYWQIYQKPETIPELVTLCCNSRIQHWVPSSRMNMLSPSAGLK
jgi:hypothetical protein